MSQENGKVSEREGYGKRYLRKFIWPTNSLSDFGLLTGKPNRRSMKEIVPHAPLRKAGLDE